MRLGDMLRTLRIVCTISIRDTDNMTICTCNAKSKGVDPYVNCEVAEWFPVIHTFVSAADIVFLIDLEDTE